MTLEEQLQAIDAELAAQLANKAGKKCDCFACCGCECVCDHDWTPPEEYELRAKVKRMQAHMREQARILRDNAGDFEPWGRQIMLDCADALGDAAA